MQPIIPQDFRHISLCNVIYKIIVKSLADRLKHHLPNYIDHSQAAFIKNRHISANISSRRKSSIPSLSRHGTSRPFYLNLILLRLSTGWNGVLSLMLYVGLVFTTTSLALSMLAFQPLLLLFLLMANPLQVSFPREGFDKATLYCHTSL